MKSGTNPFTITRNWGTQQTAFTGIILAQTALQFWTSKQSDNSIRTPFIAFDKVSCDRVDPKAKTSLAQLSIFKGNDLSQSQNSIDGNCYYLLSAQPGTGHGKMCDGWDYFPGGTNQQLAAAAGSVWGLSTTDFVAPAVEMWNTMGKANGWMDLWYDGAMMVDPLDQGIIGIPVCDYLGSLDSPGKGCPKLGQDLTSDKTACQIY